MLKPLPINENSLISHIVLDTLYNCPDPITYRFDRCVLDASSSVFKLKFLRTVDTEHPIEHNFVLVTNTSSQSGSQGDFLRKTRVRASRILSSERRETLRIVSSLNKAFGRNGSVEYNNTNEETDNIWLPMDYSVSARTASGYFMNTVMQACDTVYSMKKRKSTDTLYPTGYETLLRVRQTYMDSVIYRVLRLYISTTRDSVSVFSHFQHGNTDYKFTVAPYADTSEELGVLTLWKSDTNTKAVAQDVPLIDFTNTLQRLLKGLK